MEWRDPKVQIPVNIAFSRPAMQNIGMTAVQYGYDDVFSQWLAEGGHPVRTHASWVSRNADDIELAVDSIGLWIVSSMVRHETFDGCACMEAWIAALDRHHQDPHHHVKIFWKPLLGLIPGDDPSRHDLAPHGQRMQRCVASLVNAGINIWSLGTSMDEKVNYRSETQGVMTKPHPSLTVGDVVAGIPTRADDHGLIVTQALLHRMGYNVPHRDVSMEMHAMRTPMGSTMMHTLMPHIHDATIMSEWMSHLT
jgi:hypothetical protein